MATTVLVRVFIGAHDGQPRKFFDSVRGRIKTLYGEQCNFEVLNTDNMKRDPFRFTPAEYIDWLTGGGLYSIVGHMHQVLDRLTGI